VTKPFLTETCPLKFESDVSGSSACCFLFSPRALSVSVLMGSWRFDGSEALAAYAEAACEIQIPQESRSPRRQLYFRMQVNTAGHRWAFLVRNEGQQILDAASIHGHLQPDCFSMLAGTARLRCHLTSEFVCRKCESTF